MIDLFDFLRNWWHVYLLYVTRQKVPFDMFIELFFREPVIPLGDTYNKKHF